MGATLALSWFAAGAVSISTNLVAGCGYAYSGYAGNAPTVTSVSPTSGSTADGFNVVITGTHFCRMTADTVHFGATLSPSIIVNSDTQITSTAPVEVAGLVDVTVTTDAGTSAINAGDHFTYVASNTACTTAGLTPNVASPQQIDTTVTFTATSAACPSPQYLFYVQSPAGVWSIAQTYGGPTFVWQTAGLASIGSYNINVWVREKGNAAAVETNHIVNFVLTNRLCGGAGLTSNLASPQQVDFTVTFTATSTGCAKPQYLFYLQLPNGTWTIAQTYGGPTFVWNTTTVASIGAYNVNVWVRETNSGAAVQSNFIEPFTLTNRVCSAAGLTSDKASPQAHGAVITFTATSAGCARPQYLFYLKGPGANGTWSVAQTYDGTKWVWSTAGVASIGTYEVNVWVRATASGAAVQTNFVVMYTLT